MIDFKKLIETKEYDFLRTNEHLKENICLLGLGGSYAYGTNVEDSDIDIRGIAINTAREICTNQNFEQFIDEATDTTIYSFNKIVSLLCNCNPNVIEIMGLKPEHYLYINKYGQILLDNVDLFLSQKAVNSFCGYATAQLRRLDNKSARVLDEQLHEQHVIGSINNAYVTFPEKYFYFDSDNIKLYVDKAINPEMEYEIFMDVNLKHYPLRDYKCMWSEMHNIVKDYAKIGKRNSHAINRGKLGKHMMHLIRLYLMCLDILNEGKVITYREKEHDLLMSIRNNKYLTDDNQPTNEFMEMVDYYENEIKLAKEKTDLPKNPNYNKINDLLFAVNRSIII